MPNKPSLRYLKPNWQLPERVSAISTKRQGGFSLGAYNSFNLGAHVNDDIHLVKQNRQLLVDDFALQHSPVWLNQVHGSAVVEIKKSTTDLLTADASITRCFNVPLAIMTADCLPVLLADTQGTVVGVVHCGWRSLAANVLANTLQLMAVEPSSIIAWLGPCISQTHFEVGSEVVQQFCEIDASYSVAFVPHKTNSDKYLASLHHIATMQLNHQGVMQISASSDCTFAQPKEYFSYRREGQTGRMASLIWLNN